MEAETGVKQPRTKNTKDGQQAPEGASLLPESLQREYGPTNTLIWISSLKNCNLLFKATPSVVLCMVDLRILTPYTLGWVVPY